MPTREIKTKLTLEGEQQFKRAMRDASDAIKVLNSEEKLAAAQFKATGNEEQYLADKAEILRRKIEEQQKAVNAAQEAVNKLREKGVAPTNKAMQEWTTKLNNSKAHLTRLQGDLAQTENQLANQGEAFADAGESADAYADQLDRIGRGVDFQNTIAGLDRVQATLNGALQTIGTIALDIYNAELQAAKWADDLTTTAQQAGLDVETYQSWEYAAKLIDTDVSDIIKAQDRLMKKLGEDSDETEQIFNRLGVTTKDASGKARDYNDVFWDTIDALGQATDAHGEAITETEKDAIAQELFGKSFRELNPLINAGSKEWHRLAEEGRGVATVSAQNVDKLNKLNDAQDKLTAKLEKTKNTLLSSTAPAFTTATDRVGALVDEFNRFLETEEGQKALAGLNDAVDGLLTALTPDSFEGILNTAKKAVRGLTTALEWLGDHGWEVILVLASMKAIIGGISVAKSVLTMLQLMKNIQWLNMQKGAEALGKATGGGSGAGGAAAGAGGAAAKGAASAGGTGAAATAGVAAIMSAYAATLTAPIWGTQLAEQRDFGGFMAERQRYDETLAIKSDDAGFLRMQAMYKQLAEIAEAPGGGLTDEDVKAMIAIRKELQEITGRDFGAGMDNLLDYFRENGNDAMTDYDFQEVLGQMIADLGETLRGDSETTGKAVGDGIITGMNDKQAEVGAAAEALGNEVENSVAGALAVGSPSKVTHYLGEMAAQGLADGINARADAAVAAAAALAARVNAAIAGADQLSYYGAGMSRALYSAPIYGAYGASGRGGSPSTGIINNTIRIDGRDLAQVMTPYVSQTMSENVRSTGRR